MHTMTFGDRYRIHHHGDMGGDCLIVDKAPTEDDQPKDVDGHVTIRIPVEILLEFAAACYRQHLSDAVDSGDVDQVMRVIEGNMKRVSES